MHRERERGRPINPASTHDTHPLFSATWVAVAMYTPFSMGSYQVSLSFGIANGWPVTNLSYQ